MEIEFLDGELGVNEKVGVGSPSVNSGLGEEVGVEVKVEVRSEELGVEVMVAVGVNVGDGVVLGVLDQVRVGVAVGTSVQLSVGVAVGVKLGIVVAVEEGVAVGGRIVMMELVTGTPDMPMGPEELVPLNPPALMLAWKVPPVTDGEKLSATSRFTLAPPEMTKSKVITAAPLFEE